MNKEFVLKEIGLKIRKIRNEKNLSLVEFSDKLDIEYNNLIRIEKGRTNLTIGTLLKICEALDVNLTTIVDVEAGYFIKDKYDLGTKFK
ncbi:MAG: helix-turn-helix domain-containing protein [Prevotellaceae bacterium]|jgi:transcriptional regulator with XRE-family HTH domain|nr:helix-turn-helix domain-containing protein [Prevotellaceae bacterium]